MELAPTVIHQEMLITAIKEQSKPGEMMRLNEENPIDFNSIQSIRLEFLGILKIDHLWPLQNLTKLSLNYNKIDTIENLETLTNLKELDLSFNYIERIQNLDKLLNLEILSLFSNRIDTIENLEHLKELIILNIGANKIDSLKGFERLRFLPKLKVFNMERNPLGDRMNVRELVSAYLPKLKYYNYSHISQEEKDAAAKEYSRELRELNERESQERRALQEKEDSINRQRHHFKCFVEDLDDHQLFEKLFEEGEISGDTPEISEIKLELQNQMFSLTQKIYETGLERYEERDKEVESFRICLTNAKKENQIEGQKIICDIMEKFNSNKSPDTSVIIEEAWTKLMEMEVQLFEDIEDITKSFEFIVADLINDFVKDVQSLFDQIKESIARFSESLNRVLNDGDIQGFNSPKPTGQTNNEFVQSWWKTQKELINDREFLLQERAREWARNLMDSFKQEGVERNRKKIIEINFFFDSLRTDADFSFASQTRIR